MGAAAGTRHQAAQSAVHHGQQAGADTIASTPARTIFAGQARQQETGFGNAVFALPHPCAQSCTTGQSQALALDIERERETFGPCASSAGRWHTHRRDELEHRAAVTASSVQPQATVQK